MGEWGGKGRRREEGVERCQCDVCRHKSLSLPQLPPLPLPTSPLLFHPLRPLRLLQSSLLPTLFLLLHFTRLPSPLPLLSLSSPSPSHSPLLFCLSIVSLHSLPSPYPLKQTLTFPSRPSALPPPLPPSLQLPPVPRSIYKEEETHDFNPLPRSPSSRNRLARCIARLRGFRCL